MFDIGKRFKEYRDALGLTQAQIAEKSQMDEKHYGRIELNKSDPKSATIEKICHGFGTSLSEFYMTRSRAFEGDFLTGYKVRKLMCDGMKFDIDIHYNKQALQPGCEKCIWYDGYIGSAYFDEFELRMNAVGNTRATLFLNYEMILEVNGSDVFQELKRYIQNDKELERLSVYSDIDELTLKRCGGDALFISESNWLTMQLKDNNTGEEGEPNVLDTDNIYEPFNDCQRLLDYIWSIE